MIMIDEKELLNFFKTYKYEIFNDIDFDKYHIESVMFDGIKNYYFFLMFFKTL
jgi:hypothetical protein